MKKITIHTLVCGQVGVDPAVPDRSVSKNPIAYTGMFRSSKRRIWLPVKTFMIEHPSGLVLIDTGWDSTVRDHPISAITFPMWSASKPLLPEGQAIDEQLARMGIRPRDLSCVIMTHMDIDHDSGLRLIREAPLILLSPEEWKAIHSHQIRYVKKPWQNIPLQRIFWSPDPNAPYGKSWDVFGDGSISVLFMPGHSQGSLIVCVKGADSFALITGDTGYNISSWTETRLPGPVWNKDMMIRSLKWVELQRQLPACKAVLAAHDPEWNNMPITFDTNL